ncbi:uncharacterized protein LOC131164759 [Malania oleifera]|uniref:uncharacterized protein LOC131164759 n=1 Tax=Malania oleifera TaxID=397392 RepID=UPI0025AEA272|nr:uncharacterized protein LOC131164759 [Malania oleifera]
METLGSSPTQSPSPSSSSSSTFNSTSSNLQNCNSFRYSQPASVTRPWRLVAQRNIRNQFSRLVSYRQQWMSLSSSGRTHATSIVNAYLSQKYMQAMDLGALQDMPNIRKKACRKLFLRQDLNRRKLLSTYKDMVVVVTNMVNTSGSMRCFLKGTSNSPHVQFSDDVGDCGGIPVFAFLSISYFEKLAQELVEMFILELNLKRLLVLDLLCISHETAQQVNLHWSNELYPGEFDDLSKCNLYSKENCELVPPTIRGLKSDTPAMQSNHQPNNEVLQVYLTTWLAEVNIDTYRVDEIFVVAGEEMHVNL